MEQTILEMLQEGHAPNMVYRLDISFDGGRSYAAKDRTSNLEKVEAFIKKYVNREDEGIRIKIEKFTMERM